MVFIFMNNLWVSPCQIIRFNFFHRLRFAKYFYSFFINHSEQKLQSLRSVASKIPEIWVKKWWSVANYGQTLFKAYDLKGHNCKVSRDIFMGFSLLQSRIWGVSSASKMRNVGHTWAKLCVTQKFKKYCAVSFLTFKKTILDSIAVLAICWW